MADPGRSSWIILTVVAFIVMGCEPTGRNKSTGAAVRTLQEIRPVADKIEQHLTEKNAWPSVEQIQQWCRSSSVRTPLKYYQEGVSYPPYGNVKLAEHVDDDERDPYTIVLIFESGERRGETVINPRKEQLLRTGTVIWPQP